MTEAELLDMIISLMEERRVLWTHLPDSRHVQGDPGVPDLLVAGRYGQLWREVKTEHAPLSRAQIAWKYTLQAGAADWGVWRPSHLRSGAIARELDAAACDPAELTQDVPA